MTARMMPSHRQAETIEEFQSIENGIRLHIEIAIHGKDPGTGGIPFKIVKNVFNTLTTHIRLMTVTNNDFEITLLTLNRTNRSLTARSDSFRVLRNDEGQLNCQSNPTSVSVSDFGAWISCQPFFYKDTLLFSKISFLERDQMDSKVRNDLQFTDNILRSRGVGRGFWLR